jgi:hypothetical protein
MLYRVSQNSDEDLSVFFIVRKNFGAAVLLPQGGDGLRRRLSVLEYLSHPVC